MSIKIKATGPTLQEKIQGTFLLHLVEDVESLGQRVDFLLALLLLLGKRHTLRDALRVDGFLLDLDRSGQCQVRRRGGKVQNGDLRPLLRRAEQDTSPGSHRPRDLYSRGSYP